MLRNILLSTWLCFSFSTILADTPGKTKMEDCKISLQNPSKFPGYTFYWQSGPGDSATEVKTDRTFIIPSSQGAPYSAWFWAIDHVTKKSTDTISFDNYYSPDYVIIIDSVTMNSIHFNKKALSNPNKIVEEGNTDAISNRQLVEEAKKYRKNRTMKISLYSLAAALGLGGIIWFFVKRRGRQGNKN